MRANADQRPLTKDHRPKTVVTIQGICYDQKSSFLKGSADAPALIRSSYHSTAFNYWTELGVDTAVLDVDDRGDFHPKHYEDILSIAKESASARNPLLTLGGDHSISYPIVKALAEQFGPFEILHIDAHSDLYEDFDGDRYSHACPFARIMEEGLCSRLVQYGIRAINGHQRQQAERYGVEIIEMKDVPTTSLPQFTGPTYVSLDIDALDPAFAPGVSHQEAGGLTSRQVIDVLHNLSGDVIGADLVEFNPSRDHAGITASLSAKLYRELLGLLSVG